jgi:uncharacterized membrane protein
MPSSPNRRAVRWLRDELPALVASGAISNENAHAIERYYDDRAGHSRNFGLFILACVGSALVAAGIILLIAHNWDNFSRPVRSAFAFLPLIAAQCLSAFVMVRRDESKPWRESAAIFNVATIGTAISIVSQTYQIHGSLANFIFVWMLLSLPLIYLLRTTLGAVVYLVGGCFWLFLREKGRDFNPMFFWLLLVLVIPYFGFVYRRASASRETTWLGLALATAAAIGLGFTADFTKANIGILAFAGFFATTYISGIEFFPAPQRDRLSALALLSGVAIGVMTIVLTFEELWRHARGPVWPNDSARMLGVVLELAFPVAAVALAAWSFMRRSVHFSVLAAAFPVAAALGWIVTRRCEDTGYSYTSTNCDRAASILMDVYALALGVELVARGLRAHSTTRANFGLLVIAVLAIARFFDSDLGFVTRAIGFIIIGLGFLFANFVLFKKARTA